MSLFDESRFRTILREEVRQVMRDELARAPTPPGPGDLLKIGEAAAIAVVTPQAVRGWIANGRLPARGSGRLIRVRRSDLERFLNEPGDPPARTPEAEANAAMLRRKRRSKAAEEG